MARKLSSPLTPADIKWLRARFPENRVQAMIGDAGESPETDEETGDGDSDADGANGPENGGEDPEDLIGSTEPFDPGVKTVDEVNKYLSTADDEEKARVLALEADGKARSTILNA